MERVAIYWDFENVHACVLDEMNGEGAYRQSWFKPQDPVVDLDPVVEYALTFGGITINRAYANWQWFGRYRDELQDHAVDLVQLFPLSGAKNGADIRLAIDVVEDLHEQPHITHVLVVAGDSDYVGLAQKCRKLGRTVLGVGVAGSNSRLIAAFDEFRYYNDLLAAGATGASTAVHLGGGEPIGASLDDARDLLVRAIRRIAQGRGDPWVLKASLRPMLVRLDPAFTETRYGFSGFDRLLDAVSDTIGQRVGKHDHELCVRKDLGGAAAAPPRHSATQVSLTDIEKRLRKRGVRLPNNREALWLTAPTLIALFGNRPDGIYGSSQAMAHDLLGALRGTLDSLDDSDGNKLKGLLWGAKAFEFLGDDAGCRLVVTDPEELTRRLVGAISDRLPDASFDDLEELVATLCGDNRTGERVVMIREALETAIAAPARHPEDAGDTGTQTDSQSDAAH